jgi:hypothetical protein
MVSLVGFGLLSPLRVHLNQHNVVAVHWDQNLNRAIIAASHGLVGLRKILRQLVQLRNLRLIGPGISEPA